MGGYDDQYWSEVNADYSPLEQERQDADLREWEDELRRDREISLEVPPPRKKAA